MNKYNSFDVTTLTGLKLFFFNNMALNTRVEKSECTVDENNDFIEMNDFSGDMHDDVSHAEQISSQLIPRCAYFFQTQSVSFLFFFSK